MRKDCYDKIKLVVSLTILLSYFLKPANIYANINNYLTREEWHADKELSDEAEQKYSIIDKIYIAGITTKDSQIRANTEDWMKGLYYFFSTKTQLKDIPFNYLVSWDGMIYEGKKKEQDLVAPIENENALLIGYLSNYDNAEITPIGEQALRELLSDLVSQYDINADDIQTKRWNIKPTEDLQKTLIEVSSPNENSLITDTINEIKNELDYSAITTERIYQASISNVEYEKNLTIEENYTVALTVKNTGETNWYKDSPAEVTVALKDGDRSEFSINNEWLSNSQVAIMTNEIVKSGEEATFNFNITTPFITEENYQETFILKTKSGTVVENSEFNLEVNISTNDLQIAEVQQTPTGYLNVRETPSLGGTLITQVLPEEKFILLESQSGWGKIRLKTGEEGWAAMQYLKRL